MLNILIRVKSMENIFIGSSIIELLERKSFLKVGRSIF